MCIRDSIVGADKREEGYMQGNGYYVTWAFGHLVQPALSLIHIYIYSEKATYHELTEGMRAWVLKKSGIKKAFHQLDFHPLY